MNGFAFAVPVIVLAQAQPLTDQTVTVTFNVGSVVTAIIVGLIAGFLANVLVRGRRIGLIGAIVVGVLGGIVGNFLFSILNISVSPALLEGIVIRFIDILVAFIGAVLILFLYVILFGRR